MLGLLHGFLIFLENHSNFANSKRIIIGLGVLFAIFCFVFEFYPIIGNNDLSYAPANPTSTNPIPTESIRPSDYVVVTPGPLPLLKIPKPTESVSIEPAPTNDNLIENADKKVSIENNALEKDSKAKEKSESIGKIKGILKRSITYISGLFTPYFSKRVGKRMKKIRNEKDKKKNKKKSKKRCKKKNKKKNKKRCKKKNKKKNKKRCKKKKSKNN